jgi:hypothetical protein
VVEAVESRASGTSGLVGRILIGCVLVAAIGMTQAGVATARTSSAREPVVLWPAPPADQVNSLTEAAGLAPETHESLQHHVHAHLDVFVDGRRVVVPAGIGININDPGVKQFSVDGATAYGGIAECDDPCISPLHTHDVTGILHTESPTDVDNTLGQFFTEWDVKLTASCVDTYCTPAERIAIYVNGRRQPFKDAAAIDLSDHKEIALVIGKAPSRIPKAADFSQA